MCPVTQAQLLTLWKWNVKAPGWTPVRAVTSRPSRGGANCSGDLVVVGHADDRALVVDCDGDARGGQHRRVQGGPQRVVLGPESVPERPQAGQIDGRSAVERRHLQ